MQPPFDVYVSVDVETDGPIPGPFSMLSFGMVVVGRYDGGKLERVDPTKSGFYRELRPISNDYDAETMAVSGLSRDELLRTGIDPVDAMSDAAAWVREVAGEGTPVLVAYPLSFDWSWLYWYFVSFSRTGSPFGFSSCLDIKTAYAVRARKPIALSGASKLPPELRSSRNHVHHGLADAIEQSEIFLNILDWQGDGE
jgi:hypothetical protein